MSFMGGLDTPSFVSGLNAWIVVFGVEHEEYLEAVDLTSYVGTIPIWKCFFSPQMWLSRHRTQRTSKNAAELAEVSQSSWEKKLSESPHTRISYTKIGKAIKSGT